MPGDERYASLHPEAALMLNTLKAFSWIDHGNDLWASRHCGETARIQFRGFEWTIEIEETKFTGSGYLDLIREISRRRLYPFNRS
jgi:hypothetical protein